jgi:hypothetical protein
MKYGYLNVKSCHFPAKYKKNGHKGTKTQRKVFYKKILGVFVSWWQISLFGCGFAAVRSGI